MSPAALEMEPAPARQQSQSGMGDAGGILPLKVEALSYAAGARAIISDLAFSIGAAGRSVVLGPNGAGKTVLLRLLHGLLKPSAGRISWNGSDPAEVRSRQAMVFQKPVLLRRSLLGNITYALSARGVPTAERQTRAEEALAHVGLLARARQAARSLSGGEQQRLALARAWATRPEVLILDEPTANLDPAATHAVEGIIEAFHRGGTKILMTTHDLKQAERLADEIIFMHHGRVLEQRSGIEFFTEQATSAARAFVEGTLTW